jgi:O-antigen ligase
MAATITKLESVKSQITVDYGSPWFAASGVTLMATLMAAPLAFGAVQPWAWASLCVLSGVALVLYALGCAATGHIRIGLLPMHVVMLLALILVAGQLALGKTFDPVGTRESLIKLTGYSTTFLLAGLLSAALSPRAWRWFGFATVSYVFAMAVFAMIQFFSNTGLIYWTVKPRWGGSIFGSYVNRNHYAGLLEMLLPLAIGALLALPKHHVFKLFGSFAALLGVASVILCGSRGGTVGVGVELAIFLAVIVSRTAHETRRRSILVALAVALLGAAFFIWLDTDRALNRWETTARAPELAAESRLTMASNAIRMLRQHPVSGAGAGAFEVAYPSCQGQVAVDPVVDHAHNDFLELLAETGVAGGVLLIAALYLFARASFSKLRERLALPGGWMQAAATIACCGLLVHSFTDFNLHIPANAAWFSFCTAVACAPSGTPSHSVAQFLGRSHDENRRLISSSCDEFRSTQAQL